MHAKKLVEVDGSYGEGGGQLLRYSVALATLLGKSLRIYNIRAKRDNPGLRPQHLAAVTTIADIAGARVRGLSVGSTELYVEPSDRPKGGSFEVDIGTAGSISLLLQAALPVLAAASGGVKLVVRGGTDVKWAPPIDYFRYVLLPLLREFGLKANLKLLRRGYYPQGGGAVEVRVEPSYPLKPVAFVNAGELREIQGISYASNLPKHVAERQAQSALEILRREGYGDYLGEIDIDVETPALGVGSGIVLWAKFERGVVGGDALGEKGKRAEVVGREAAEKLLTSLKHEAPVDPHAFDNLVIYMALADGVSRAATCELTSHAETAIWLCSLISGAEFRVEKTDKLIEVAAKGIGYRP